jgi:adenine phosphoribosyltransferase
LPGAPSSPPKRRHCQKGRTSWTSAYPRIPDFPKPGILFYDISTLLRDADAWQVAMGRMARAVRQHQPDLIAGSNRAGFSVAAPLALKLGCGFIMVRKPASCRGRRSGTTMRSNTAPTGSRCRRTRVHPGQRVVVVDDLLATGGTMVAAIELLKKIGAVVPAAAALIELTFLNGRSRCPCRSIRRWQTTSRRHAAIDRRRGLRRRGFPA